MERDPIKNDGRKALQQRRLGPSPVCVLCGEAELTSLQPARRKLLEDHHLAGAAIDGAMTVALCRNCHAKLTAGQWDLGADLVHAKDRDILEVIAAILDEAGRFMQTLGERLVYWAQRLRDFVAALDARYPEWRDMEEAAP